MRGNDLLAGTPDIMVQDTLTGNILMKVFLPMLQVEVTKQQGLDTDPA